MSTTGERLKEARNALGLRQNKFAEAIGVAPNYIYMLESGRAEVKDRVIKDVCKTYNVSYDWLVNGDGEMFNDDSIEGAELVEQLMAGTNNFAKKVLVAFSRMDEEHWQCISDLIDEIKKED